MNKPIFCITLATIFFLPLSIHAQTYPVVDTAVSDFYSNDAKITQPYWGEEFYGQDAHYTNNPPSYTDNGNGTVTDNVTGLMWQKYMGDKKTFTQGISDAKNLELGGYSDWRVPTIKELYSLIIFTGNYGNGPYSSTSAYIDTLYFNQPYGDSSKGERKIDAQTWSSTEYVGKTMERDKSAFGVNFIDGRIKSYPIINPRGKEPNKMYFRYVRGNNQYGINQFVDNNNGTISDGATNLMWQKSDTEMGMSWQNALKYCQNLTIADYKNWRLPSAKELNTIVDYTRSLQTTQSPTIDPIFVVSKIKDMKGEPQYPYFWTSTTHLDGKTPYSAAVYFAFGEAKGIHQGRLTDVHGAGAQRSDPKTGSRKDYPKAFGPQGDIRRVYNYARCVRDIKPPQQ